MISIYELNHRSWRRKREIFKLLSVKTFIHRFFTDSARLTRTDHAGPRMPTQITTRTKSTGIHDAELERRLSRGSSSVWVVTARADVCRDAGSGASLCLCRSWTWKCVINIWLQHRCHKKLIIVHISLWHSSWRSTLGKLTWAPREDDSHWIPGPNHLFRPPVP